MPKVRLKFTQEVQYDQEVEVSEEDYQMLKEADENGETDFRPIHDNEYDVITANVDLRSPTDCGDITDFEFETLDSE